jgi:Flp pilus assembly pilin Flp
MAAGSIVIDLLMKTGSFETDTKRAEKALANFQKQAADVGKAVGLAFVAFGTAAAASVKSSIDSADAFAKAAQKVGVTVEALSSLAYAAELSGLSQDQLSSSLVRLTKGLSDASQGTGEAKKAFDALGISVTDSAGNLKSSDVALAEIADKFAQYADGAEKTALAVSLFGKSGAELIPFLNQGARGIAALQQEANKLGITLDTNTAKAAEQFNDNLTRIQSIAGGLSNRIAAQLLPTLVNLTERFFESAKGSSALDQAARVATAAIQGLISVGLIVGGIFKTLGEALGGVFAALIQAVTGNFSEAFTTAKNVVFDFGSNVKSTIENVSAVWSAEAVKIESQSGQTSDKFAAPIIKANEKVKKETDKIAKQLEAMYQSVETKIKSLFAEIAKLDMTDVDAQLFDLSMQGARPEQLERAKELLLILEQNKDRRERIAETVEKEKIALERLNAVIEGTPTGKIDKLRDEIQYLYDLLDQNKLTFDQFSEAVQVALGNVADSSETNFDLMTEFAEQAARNIQDAFANFLFDPFENGLKGMLQGFVTVLRRMAAEALSSKIFEMLGQKFGGTSGILGTFFSAFGGSKAGGGDVISGRSYLVGENGPEMFVPRTAGTIAPNESLQGSAPQVNVRNINVLDPSLIGDYLKTDSGEQLIMNVLQRNRGSLQF